MKPKEKEDRIKISGTWHPFKDESISFKQVVDLYIKATDSPTGENIIYIVSWESKPEKKAGTLVAGQTVEIIKGIKFVVEHSNRA